MIPKKISSKLRGNEMCSDDNIQSLLWWVLLSLWRGESMGSCVDDEAVEGFGDIKGLVTNDEDN